jgi:hypothetical protein
MDGLVIPTIVGIIGIGLVLSSILVWVGIPVKIAIEGFILHKKIIIPVIGLSS